MHGHHGLCARGYFFLDLRRVNIVGVGIDIDKDGTRAATPYAARRGKKRICGKNHFVGFAFVERRAVNSATHQRGDKGVRAARHTDGVGNSAIFGNPVLKLRDIGAADKILAVENVVEDFLRFRAKRLILNFQI